MKNQIEYQLDGNDGYILVVLRGNGGLGHRCGYVSVPQSHPLFRVHYITMVPVD